MHCSLDSGLVVVVFIVCCLLWVVGLLLFHDFGNICDRTAAKTNDSTSVVMVTIFNFTKVKLLYWQYSSTATNFTFFPLIQSLIHPYYDLRMKNWTNMYEVDKNLYKHIVHCKLN